MNMVGDGLNGPRHQGGRQLQNKNENIYPDKYRMHQTRELKVINAKLSSVPNYVFEDARRELVNSVNLEGNLLTEVPQDTQVLNETLTELFLQKNQIGYMPSYISQFSRLQICDLSCNLLRDLPMEFAGLQSLQELNLSFNRLVHLPRCIYELRKLVKLSATNNKIVDIDATPDGLGALKCLKLLNLSNNEITYVPPILGNLVQLSDLKLSGNPFRQPRQQIISKGTHLILHYLREHIPRDG